MRGRSTLASAALIVISVSIGVPAAAAAPAVVSGELSSAASKLPKSASNGSAQVLAMGVDTGAFGDADTVGKNGRYSLKLPPGKWALRTSVVAKGKRYASFLSASIVTRSGQSRSLPLTLRKFKKPRKRRRGKPKRPRKRPPPARRSNINPRDGRSYPGVAYAVKEFDVTASNGALGVFRKGMADMLITDLVTGERCEFTMVEWEHRAAIEREISLQQSEYFDPASRVEPGHLIDPEVFIRGRLEDRPGSPPRNAILAWLEDAKTGARISDDVSVVALEDALFGAEERLAKLVLRDLICARANPPPAQAGPPAPPPAPKPVSDTYSGTFGGTADAVMEQLHWSWNGHVEMDAAQDLAVPPPGGPPGEYRLFTVTSGNVHFNHTGGDAKCSWSGSGDLALKPGNGYLWVQLEVDNPAYFLSMIYNGGSIEVKKSGSECEEETFQMPVFENLASTEQALISPSTTLSGSETHNTPETFDYDYTTNWNLNPG
jgi:hypothetical protein